MKKILSILICWQMMFSLAYGASTKKNSKGPGLDIKELALPSEVESVAKPPGAIFYSPSVKGKVLVPVHFWGEVGRAGLHFIPLGTSLVKGLSLAGGPKSSAVLSNIRVNSFLEGKSESKTYDLSSGGGELAHTTELRSGDTVYIKKDNYLANRAYYTSLIGVAATILSSIFLFREVRK